MGVGSTLVGPGLPADRDKWQDAYPNLEVIRVPSAKRWRSAVTAEYARSPGRIVHAHSAGTPAGVLLTTRVPFLVTVYGSEIFAPRNRVAKLVTTLALRKASAVSVTSPIAAAHVEAHAPDADIHHFSLGFNDRAFYVHEEEPRARIVSVRRFLPNYRIVEILDAFAIYRSRGGSADLVLLRGHIDADSTYALLVYERIRSLGLGDAVKVIDEILTQEDLGQLLGGSRAVVSVPETDQLSTTLLEGLATGCSLIISENASYAPICGLSHVSSINPTDGARFADAMMRHADTQLSRVARDELSAAAGSFNAQVDPALRRFYGLAS